MTASITNIIANFAFAKVNDSDEIWFWLPLRFWTSGKAMYRN